MSESTPSQAEGERFPDDEAPDNPPRTTPSQAEGEAEEEEEQEVGGGQCHAPG